MSLRSLLFYYSEFLNTVSFQKRSRLWERGSLWKIDWWHYFGIQQVCKDELCRNLCLLICVNCFTRLKKRTCHKFRCPIRQHFVTEFFCVVWWLMWWLEWVVLNPHSIRLILNASSRLRMGIFARSEYRSEIEKRFVLYNSFSTWTVVDVVFLSKFIPTLEIKLSVILIICLNYVCL